MRYVLTIFFSFSFLTGQGQTIVSNDTLQWRESRPITWDDFKGEPMEGLGLAGEIFCMNLANFERPNAFQKTKFKVVAIFDRTKSWIDSNARTETGLIYFLVMFNIYEVHARSLRRDLATSKFGYDPTPLFQEKYNNSMTNLANEFNQFRRETKMGADVSALMTWKKRVEEELITLEEFRR
ncbi:hypothetical protein [Chryseotalea sanaruensis]|nr:hypothetical protein [Chryseotalea sanaruensis]